MSVKFRLIIWLLLCNLPLHAQIGGTVTDPGGEPLAFVSILPNEDPALVVLSDIEGRFTLKKGVEVRSLSFRYVGYETLRLEGDSLRPPLRVVLRPAEYDLPEAVVTAGENPANILIRRAVARRDDNNPDKRRSYTCLTYNKMTFDPVPQRRRFEELLAQKDTSEKRVRDWAANFEAVEKNLERRHTFLMESVTERRFLQPDLVQENVLTNRVSGFQSAGLVALANAVQPFSFYGDNLRIVDREYVNPLSPGSTNLYFFNIEDTLYQQPDTIYVISFKPRQGKVFTALEGVLHLHSFNWAIQNVRARPAGKAGNLEMSIEQAYQLIDTDAGRMWFPAQLNFELALPHYPEPTVGIRASGKSYVTEVRIDPPLRLRDFNPETPLLLPPGASTRADSAWERWHRLSPLSKREQATYVWLDSLGDKKKFDTWANWLNAVSTGRFPLYKQLHADLNKLLKFNEFENVRVGFGLTNAHARPLQAPRRLEWSTYGGYGFRDKSWKYGASVLWRLARSRQTQLQVFARQDLREPGALYELSPAAFVNRSLYAARMDFSRELGASFGSRLWKGAQLRLSAMQQDIRPGYDYRYGDETTGLRDRFRFREATVFFRYAYGENNRALLGSNVQLSSKWPVLEAAWTRGWGDYTYERRLVALYQSVYIRRLGRASWRIEAGQVSADAPLAKLFTLNQIRNGGANRSWSLFVVRNTFQVLPDTLFAADQFVNAYIAQEIGPVFYKKKYSAPYLTLLQNFGWGRLQRPELHQDMPLRVADKPLLETGVQLDDLYRFNYVNFAYMGLGVAVFYRWGGLHSAKPEENIILRLSLRLTL